MSQNEIKNPFVIYGYVGPEYFCDREKETSRLVKYLTNGNNIVLSAPRRVGKTDLISHLFQQSVIKEHFITINIDIYSTKTFGDFVAQLGKAIVEALRPKGKSWMSRFLEFVTSLRAQVSFDLNGMPEWKIGVGQNIVPETTLDEIFKFINSSGMPCLIAIDEFQQITRYKEAWQAEALLRTYIQQCPHSRFIFSGSQRHLMTELFTTPSRPFYASSIIMDLPLIPEDVYTEFCCRMFKERGKELDPQVVAQLYKRFYGITAYMHRTLNVMFSNTQRGGLCMADSIDEAIEELLEVSRETYAALLYQLTEKQASLLKAIAREERASNIQGAQFIRKHGLTTPSSVMSAAKILLDRDILTRQGDTYWVSDQFFGLWLQRQK
ncbi:MAG: ATPase [Bacteroidales bacterium]|nr:ATPase [Bacteroidales bacterium]